MNDLHHHGDDDLGPDRLPGDLDLAVNVRLPEPPAWLQARLARALTTLSSYPSQTAALEAVAARHGRPPDQVLLTNGAAEAFTLVAQALRPTRPVCLHPSFTAPEAALVDAGLSVTRVVLEAPFALDPSLVPDDADLVVVGNPTNPTGVLHPAETLVALARPGRTLVVDEAFLDALPGEPESLASRTDVPGLLVVRSITKTWGLAGLRAGYVLGDPAVLATLRAAQSQWPLNALALEALAAVSTPEAVAWAQERATETQTARAAFEQRLSSVVEVSPGGTAPFLLVRAPAGTRERLQRKGIWARRGDTFPGLDETWLRLAVPAPEEVDRVVDALSECLTAEPPARARTTTPRTGRVTLIGAGPGDQDLFTRRAWAALHAADVVVTDRLVDEALLAGLRPGVVLVDAGKAPGAHRMTQEQINDALVEWASRGHDVARLKGGDPFVFGRGAEEALACAAAGIPVTVIPGLSSAISAATLAGIPVTHRGVARSFAVLSGHLPPGHPANPVDWVTVARSVDTLVVLMSIGNLPAITAELIRGGLSPETPAACLEQASTTRQRVSRCTLADLPHLEAANPAVVVIGPTVGVLDPR